MGSSAITKRMQLLVEWADKGFDSGLDKKRKGIKDLKKDIKDLAKAMLAAAAVAVGLTAGLLKLIKQGAEVKSVQESFEGFVRAAKMSPDTLDKVRESVRGTISDMELMNATVRGLSMGLDPGRIVEFWQKSKQIADVSSQDTLMVFESLVMGMTKLEVETLKTIGITIRAEDVYKDYAASIGKTQAELTTYDRTIAFSIALEEKYRKNFQGVGDVTTRVREKFQQLTSGVKNLWNRFVVMIAESPKIMGFLAFLSGEVGNLDAHLESMRPGLDRVIATIILLSRKSLDAAKGIKGWRDELLSFGLIAGIGVLIAKLAAFKTAIAGAFGSAALAKLGIAGAVAYLLLNYKKTLQAFLTILDSVSRAFYYTIGGIIEGIQLLIKAINKIPGIDLSGMIESFEPTLAWFRKQAFGETIFDKWKANIEKWPSLFDLIGKKLFGKKDEFRDQAESVKRELSFIEDLEIRRKATPQFELAISDPLWALKETGKKWKKEAERTIGGFWEDYENAYEEGRKKAALEIAKQNELLAKQQFFTTPKLEIPKPIHPQIEPLEVPNDLYPKLDPLRIPDPIYPIVQALKVPAYPRLDPLRIPDPIYPEVPALTFPPYPKIAALRIPEPIYPALHALRVPAPIMPKVPPLYIPDPIYPVVMALRIPRPLFEGQWPVQVPAPIYEQSTPPVIAAPIVPDIPAIEIPRPVGMDAAKKDIEYYTEMIMTLKTASETVPYFREKYNIPEPAQEIKPQRREELAMLDDEEQAFLESWDRRVEHARESSDIMLEMEQERYLGNADLWEMERVSFLRNMQMREQAYRAGYQAMGQYSDKFFNRNAKLMRVTNAILIKGATEAVASWIEARSEEWRYQAAANTYEMFAALARKDFYAAGLYGKSAAGWAALAGGAAIAAGGIRYAGQHKAESMMSEQETQWEEATTGGGTEELARQKREASGVVNARPIHINVYSTANFNSGYMIFGDSETAAGELYADHFRIRIESDIESGAIQIP